MTACWLQCLVFRMTARRIRLVLLSRESTIEGDRANGQLMGEAPRSPLHAAACWNPNSRCPTEILCSSAFGGKVAMRHTGLPFGGMPRGCRSRKDQQLNPLPSRTEAPHQYSLGGHPQEPLRPHAGLEQPPASDCSTAALPACLGTTEQGNVGHNDQR